ncbi:NrdR family transcriptional regulator [Synergistes jonesii]|uniref:NrdR family transcriptional regulator n=1 Tax=Synergistes jonesii TaxID=2754 RepID=UPI00248E0C47|nr:ogr/Delta-like zinc finger family protein [Synergistes jonesii]
MICPNCGSKMNVNNTEDLLDIVRRKRRCKNCGKYFITYEVLERPSDRDGAAAKKRRAGR